MEKLHIHEELKSGGEWLGSARSWMQSNIQRGDTLCWSSGELVSIPFCKLEEFARHVAIAAVAEDRKKHKRANVELSGDPLAGRPTRTQGYAVGDKNGEL